MRAATISFAEFQVRLLFEDGYYLGCDFYSNKYGIQNWSDSVPITVVRENFGIKNFRMHSGVWNLNTQNIFYSELLTVRKKMCERVPARCTWWTVSSTARNCKLSVCPESVVSCSYNLEFAMLILTYFKPKDGLPNPKGPCLCRFHCKWLL